SAFNRRIGGYYFGTPDGHYTWTSMIHEWANKMKVHIEWHIATSGPVHALTFTATPIIDGVPHPEYSGSGSTQSKAKDRASEKIASSGHC
ncbi:hypothetical protein BDV93DRAFT_408323, partial [Ceratobasidium sp. AG-I]